MHTYFSIFSMFNIGKGLCKMPCFKNSGVETGVFKTGITVVSGLTVPIKIWNQVQVHEFEGRHQEIELIIIGVTQYTGGN